MVVREPRIILSAPADVPLTVGVVIPCRNESGTIAALLDAIADQEQHADEVVVVDDGSTDATGEVAAAWQRAGAQFGVRLVRSSGRGAAAALNAGITALTSDIIVRLDGHSRPAPGYIRRSLAALSRPNAGVVGGVWKIQPGAKTVVARAIAVVLSHPFGSGGAHYRRPDGGTSAGPRIVDTVPFGTFRRELWNRLGGFDESLIRNQDYDFNYRARLAGLDVLIDPAIMSVYRARSTFGALARQYFDYGFWKVVMLRKFPKSLRLRQLLPMLLLPSLLALVIWAAAGQAPAPISLLGAYIILNLLGAADASVRAGDWRLTPFALVALLVLQNAWSAGAWTSLLQGARGRRR